MERPEKVITKPSAVRPELGRRDTESPDMFPLCASAPLWPIIEPLLCRNRGLNRTTEVCGSAPKLKTAPVLKCQVVQKRCRNGAVLPLCAVREPKLVHFRSGTGGGSRFPEDRGGGEATRRVKLNGAENENRYKNSTETFRNVRAGWVSHWGWAAPSAAAAAPGSAPPRGQSVRVGKIDERSETHLLGLAIRLKRFPPILESVVSDAVKPVIHLGNRSLRVAVTMRRQTLKRFYFVPSKEHFS